MKKAKNIGFTLAEVLITLSIIGVVAALTMPSLIAHHQKTVVETRLAKFYSNINQAIAMSEAENGDRKDWLRMEHLITKADGTVIALNDPSAITAKEWYNKYLKKYIKVIRAEESETAENKYDLYFPDGSMVTFSGSSWIFYPEAKNYTVSLLDDESELKDRNRKDNGKTNFTFLFKAYDKNFPSYYNKGVEPYTSNSSGTSSLTTSTNVLKNDPNLGCYVKASNEHAYCTELIRQNGWKIPKDYPWFK